jgi:hypothetical protein
MPLLQTSGNITADGYGGGAASVPNYIEDVFSTWLIKTPGSATAVGAVNNSIDLSTKGGMVWLKDRNFAYDHTLVDTARGATQRIRSNTTNAQASTSTYGFTSFNTNGFTLGDGGGVLFDNGASGTNVVSWTFRKQAKFFDVVTYTGNGADPRTVSHNLGSTPGCIIIKRTDATSSIGWAVYHRSSGNLCLNSTAAQNVTFNGDVVTPTSTTFNVSSYDDVNASGGTYVAYLFAHNAGGFGLTGTDNVITCGSFTADGSGNFTVNLGYEPQWLMFKRTDSTSNWVMIDNMRGWTVGGDEQRLYANTSGVEAATANYESLTATGFASLGSSYVAGAAFIYIAIRRGPMKVPTTGTSVFTPQTTVNASFPYFTSGFPVDFGVRRQNRNSTAIYIDGTRLAGENYLQTNSTAAETAAAGVVKWDSNTGWYGAGGTAPQVSWMFQRAPNFFDVVCYTGTGANATQTHNLRAVPEMMIVKKRGGVANWAVYHSALGAAGWILLNTTAASSAGSDFWQSTTPTSTNFYTGTNGNVGDSGLTYVAYLFATLTNVSKVGSYTGTAALLTVNCGFTSGARFVLIKRTDTTGDWWTYDSARGITSGNDPYLFLNSTAAEVTSTNYVDTDTTGFKVTAAAPAGLNASGGTYIFLAIA